MLNSSVVQKEPFPVTDKFIFRFVAAVTIFVIIVVFVLSLKVIPKPAVSASFLAFLPKLNAIINGTCSVLLLLSLYYIRKLNITMHKRINITAFVLSSVFLVSYILFHWLSPETKYGDINGDGILSAQELAQAGNMRTLYLAILLPHILLAAAVLPLILLSFYRGLQMQVEKHKKLVRWTFPIWLYVTVSGVIVYLMIAPYYHF